LLIELPGDDVSVAVVFKKRYYFLGLGASSALGCGFRIYDKGVAVGIGYFTVLVSV